MNRKIHQLCMLLAATITTLWWPWTCLIITAVDADPQINLLNKGCSQYNATNASEFYTNLNATFSDLRTQLMENSSHFATAQRVRGSNPVYAIVQCRNYLSAADCVACFTAAVSQIRNCSAANGGRVIYDGCFLRYITSYIYSRCLGSLVLYSKLLAATFLMRAHTPLELRRTTMALKPAILQHMNPTISCCLKQPYEFQQLREKPLPLKGFEFHVKRRRIGAMAAISWVALLAKEALFTVAAFGFELPLVAPDQTVAEAEDEIRGHAQALLEVKDLIEFESWRELQAALRKSSSLLKQDFYTIIQGKPASERPQLRKLYTDLFNNVTRLDYAARDKDASYIRQCYDNIVVVMDQILSRI